MAGFRMEPALRPCLVDGKKHLFHRWSWRAWVAEPGIMIGSAPGGQCSVTLAIVEDEFGQVREVYPREVKFLDPMVSQFDFGEEAPPKCSCYHEEHGYPECWGTKERETCSCGGDKTKCTFYSKGGNDDA